MFFQEMRGSDSKNDEPSSDSKKRRYTEESRSKARERFSRDDSQRSEPSGFGRRPRGGEDNYSDEDDEDDRGGDHHRGDRKSSRRSAGCKRFLQGVDRLFPNGGLADHSSSISQYLFYILFKTRE